MPHSQGLTPDTSATSIPSARDVLEARLRIAFAGAARAGTPNIEPLHDAVCRYARAARQRDVAARETVANVFAHGASVLHSLPSAARREFERQLAWWVAQEYHRDD